MKISEKTFVVTGGGNGIAREVVLGLLAKGARVATLDLSKDGLAETARLANAGDRLSTHVVNITDRTGVEKFAQEAIKLHGAVDGVLNIAGVIQKFVKVIDLPYEEVEKVMNVNFYGVVNVVKTFLPHLITRPEAAILNVSSMGGFAAVPGQAVYGASKAAVALLTEALYAELMGTNVQVTTIYPGAIATDITKNSGVENPGGESAETTSFKMTSAKDAAAVIITAVEKGKFRAMIGGDAAALDKMKRFSPRKATELIAKKMGSLLG